MCLRACIAGLGQPLSSMYVSRETPGDVCFCVKYKVKNTLLKLAANN